MLLDYDLSKTDSEYSGMKKSALGDQLATLQRQCNYLKIPVVIIVDGWESSGRGYIIHDLISSLDPKHYRVRVLENQAVENKPCPFLCTFWCELPVRGDFTIFDKSFYYELMSDINIDSDELDKSLVISNRAEKILYDDNAIVLKFFVHLSESTQKKTIKEYLSSKNKDFLVSKYDIKQNENYSKYLKHFDSIIKKSDSNFAPWNIVSSEDRSEASKFILGKSIELIQTGIDRILYKRETPQAYKRDYNDYKHYIEDLDLSLKLSDEDYDDKLKPLQKQAGDLAYEMYKKDIPCIIVFEGMDASGKGGAIKRLVKKIDPRGYNVATTSAPTDSEKSHHYLWRFCENFPSRGNMTIFDRSWYGRVLVERVEGFANVEEWDRAYDEINTIERDWCKFGALIIKFFLVIDKDEQLKRFKERENDRYYKITEEDWRNREKWDDYVLASNEMIDKNSTDCAPWILVEANDKKFSRIKVLETFVEAAKKRLKK